MKCVILSQLSFNPPLEFLLRLTQATQVCFFSLHSLVCVYKVYNCQQEIANPKIFQILIVL